MIELETEEDLRAWVEALPCCTENKKGTKTGDPTTPAMRLGLTDRPWKWERVLGRRLFPDREKLAGTWLELYRREWTTPELLSNTRHRPVFTY